MHTAPGLHHEEEVLGKAYDARIMRRILGYMRPHRRLVALALGLLVAVSAAQLAQPYLVKLAIDGPIAGGDPAGLVALVLAYAALLMVELLLRFAQIYTLEKTGQNIVHDLRRQTYDHLQSLASSFFDRNPVGRLVTRLTTDIESLSEVFASGVVTLLGDGLKLVGIVAILFWMDPRLALLTVGVIPLLALGAGFFRTRIREAFRRVRTRLARLHAHLHETLSGMMVVQLFRREEANRSEFRKINRSHLDAEVASVRWDSIFSAVIELAGSLTMALIIWFGGGRVLREAITFGTLVAFLEYAQKFFGPIRELGSFYSVMQSAMASSERIFALLDTKPEILPPAQPRPIPPHAGDTPVVEFDDVHFSYDGGPPVLQGLSFAIRRGETVACVGSTGAGKSTIVKLLCRLYDIDGGTIRVHGTDIRALDPTDLRRTIGVVLQDHVLFSGTVAGNIGLGDAGIPPDRIVEAARAVRAEAFIRDLTGGFDATVRERGANFSVGQKQLLSFARVLAFDPPVLVLDEATASVDSQTEMHIQEALRTILSGRASLVIAHRLSTIREADRILVLHKGRVREEGTHDELIARDGIYSTLHRLQFQETEPADTPASPTGG